MRAEESAPAPGRATRRGKPKGRLRRVLTVTLTVALCLVLARAAFDVWRHVVVPDDAPRIAISLDDTWLNDLGVPRAAYEQAFARAGGNLVAVSPEDIDEGPVTADLARKLLAGMQALLLTGGGDVDPELYDGAPADASGVDRGRDDFEIALIREARRRGLPILGICRGCQILNVAHGGTLRNLRADEALSRAHFNFGGHAVELEAGSSLARVLETTRLERVESFHGQAVGTPGADVRVVARAGDVVEAIEIGDPRTEFVLAVQWHPELTVVDEKQQALLRAFVEAAARRR